jgi:hypothetical protein
LKDIHKIEEKINTVLNAKQNSTLRCDALERYMELILGINGDLSRFVCVHVCMYIFTLLYMHIYIYIYIYIYIHIYKHI